MLIPRPLAAAILALVMLASAGVVVAITAAERSLTDQRQIHAAALGECQRVQLLRDRVNANSGELYAIGTILTTVVAEPSLILRLSPEDREARVAAVNTLLDDLKTLRYDPPTDCPAAVSDPRYKPPAVRPFR